MTDLRCRRNPNDDNRLRDRRPPGFVSAMSKDEGHLRSARLPVPRSSGSEQTCWSTTLANDGFSPTMVFHREFAKIPRSAADLIARSVLAFGGSVEELAPNFSSHGDRLGR